LIWSKGLRVFGEPWGGSGEGDKGDGADTVTDGVPREVAIKEEEAAAAAAAATDWEAVKGVEDKGVRCKFTTAGEEVEVEEVEVRRKKGDSAGSDCGSGVWGKKKSKAGSAGRSARSHENDGEEKERGTDGEEEEEEVVVMPVGVSRWPGFCTVELIFWLLGFRGRFFLFC